MSESPFAALHDRLAVLEAKLEAYEKLISQVQRTCGQGNCNCVGSNQIKRIMQDLGITPSIERKAR